MSRKHNTKHPNRGLSKYPERLRKRGLGKTPTMADLQTLKHRQRDIAPIPAGKMAKLVHVGWDLDEEEVALDGTDQVQKLPQGNHPHRRQRHMDRS